MTDTIKNVAIAGAAGNLGKIILQDLLETKKFNITILTRKASASTPDGVLVKETDYSSKSQLTTALQGQDAVIDATFARDTFTSSNLIEAAVEARVGRFILSEYGNDLDNPNFAALPILQSKVANYELMKKKAQESGITWTAVASGPFLDAYLQTGFLGILLKDKKVTLFNDGKNVFPSTPMAIVGHAAAAVLLHLDETENRRVYISAVCKSQVELLNLAKEALGSDGWEVESRDIEPAYKQALADVKAGKVDMMVFGTLMQYAMSNPEYSRPWRKNDNELLGVNQLSDVELKDMMRGMVSEK
ncbi:NAD(P)-binding protein [Mollisia scopiformis]